MDNSYLYRFDEKVIRLMGWFDSVTPSQFLPFTTSPLFWFDGYDIPFRGFSFQSIRGLIIGHGVFPTADWSGLHLFSTGKMQVYQ